MGTKLKRFNKMEGVVNSPAGNSRTSSLNNSRNSSIELLRIIAMFFILLSHSSVHGFFPKRESLFYLNNLILDWCVLGNLGVNIFLIISGYFLCEKYNAAKSATLLHSYVLFYSILGIFVAVLFNVHLSIIKVATSLFPVIFCEYWFFTAYLVMLLLTPYINSMIKVLTKDQHFKCLLIMFFLWVIIPTFTSKNMYGAEFSQFLFFYILGAYIKKYPDFFTRNVRLIKCICFLSFLLLFLSSTILSFIGMYIPIILKYTTFFYGRNSFLVFLCAVGLFSILINRNPFHNKLINIFGRCTFGVYLIHENIFFREILWGTIFPNYKFYDSCYLILFLFLSVIVLYLCCSLIEYIRIRFLENKIYIVYLFFYNALYTKVNHIIYSIRKTVENKDYEGK